MSDDVPALCQQLQTSLWYWQLLLVSNTSIPAARGLLRTTMSILMKTQESQCRRIHTGQPPMLP